MRPLPDADAADATSETDHQLTERLAYEAHRIEAADAAIAEGRFVTLEAVQAWAKTIGTPDETPAPATRS